MKKPLFNNRERRKMHEDNSLSASTMKLDIAIKRFEKAFMKTFIGRFIEKTVNWLARLLA